MGSQLENFRWLEQRTLGLEAVGWLELEGAPTEGFEHEILTARVRHMVAPTWVLTRPAQVTIVALPEDWVEAQVRAELAALGFNRVSVRPHAQVAVALKSSPPLTAGPMRKVTAGDHVFGGVLLAMVALLPALLGSWRRDARTFFLNLMGVPFALGLAAAAGDVCARPELATGGFFALLLAAWVALVRSLGWRAPAARPPNAPMVTRVAVVIAALSIATLVLKMGLRPEGMIDAIAMYNMRARAIVLDTAFLGPFHPAEGVYPMHPDYPPLIPFAVAGAYRLAAAFTAVAPMWVQLCLWVGGVGLLFEHARRTVGALTALAVLALLMLLPHWQGLIADQCCDVALGLAFAASLCLWFEASDGSTPAKRRPRAALVSGLLLGAVILTKNEGLLVLLAWLTAIVALTGHSLLNQPRATFAFFVGLTPAAILNGAFSAHVPPNDLLAQMSLANVSVERASKIAHQFIAIAFAPGSYVWVFPIVALGSLAAWFHGLRSGRGLRGLPEPVRVLPPALAAVVLGYFVVYLTVDYDVDWLLQTSCQRLFAQLFPAAIFLGVALLAWKKQQRTEP